MARRRDFYFVPEDIAGLEGIARAAAEALSFPLAIERRSLAEVVPIILPSEAIGETRPRGLGRRPRSPDALRILGVRRPR